MTKRKYNKNLKEFYIKKREENEKYFKMSSLKFSLKSVKIFRNAKLSSFIKIFKRKKIEKENQKIKKEM